MEHFCLVENKNWSVWKNNIDKFKILFSFINKMTWNLTFILLKPIADAFRWGS